MKMVTVVDVTLQIANSQNRVFLSGNSLMLNINEPTFDDLSEKLKSKK
jgi:prohibitin 2